MDVTEILPDVGVDVPLPEHVDLSFADDLSYAQLAYVTLFFKQQLVERAASPETFHDFAQYTLASGSDWSGFDGAPSSPTSTAENHEGPAHDVTPENAPSGPEGETRKAAPIPEGKLPSMPENVWDTIPVIAEITRQLENTQEAVITHFCRQIQPAFASQPEYFGSPVGVVAYKNSTSYFKEVLRFSSKTTKKIHERMPYVTWNPGQDPTMDAHQPKLLKLAEAFKEGTIPAENLDRIVWLDQDLTKYANKTSARPEDKDTVLREFEPTLVEAAESSNPDAFNAARRRWANKIANALDDDGPPIAQTLRKKPDNVIKDQAYADGSGKIWIHATPDVFAEYKNFAVNQLNRNGTPVKIDDALAEWLYSPIDEDNGPSEQAADTKPHAEQAASDEDNRTHTEGQDLFGDLAEDHPLNTATLNDLTIDRHPDTVMAQDEQGVPITQKQLDAIEPLSPGELLGAILIGAMKAIFSMDPDELQVKKSHGVASSLMIIQDIETAYKSLGIGAIPKEARRPQGPHGIVPTVLKRPDPDDPNTAQCNNPDHLLGVSPPWTGYTSEALNVGALHPKDAKILACDSQLVGQIWNQHHSVLNQRRAHRAFTPTQRRAILARDRGCQAPGCTIIAAYCQIHHIEPWELGGLTDVDNAITLCAHHHAAVHNEKWSIRTIDGTHFFQPAPWLDPYQPLLRNMYWAI